MSKVRSIRLAGIVARSRTARKVYAMLESLRRRDHLRYLGMNRRIILKWNLKERDM
jgi:hypothetical protein